MGKSIIGIGVDNYAALAVEGEDYFVTSLNDTKGSVGYDSESGAPVFSVDDEGNQGGVPGIWIKRVVPIDEAGDLTSIANYKISYELLPSEGKLLDLYKADDAAAMKQLSDGLKYIDSINVEVQDELQRCRSLNPSDCKETDVEEEDEEDSNESKSNGEDVSSDLGTVSADFDTSEGAGKWHFATSI